MSIDYATHKQMMECRDAIYKALVAVMNKRDSVKGMGWIEDERHAVTIAANSWALNNGFYPDVSDDDVERIEQQAVGRMDYASKLALYVAEYVCEVGGSG